MLGNLINITKYNLSESEKLLLESKFDKNSEGFINLDEFIKFIDLPELENEEIICKNMLNQHINNNKNNKQNFSPSSKNKFLN